MLIKSINYVTRNSSLFRHVIFAGGFWIQNDGPTITASHERTSTRSLEMSDFLRGCWQVVRFTAATCSPGYWFGVVKRRKESRDSPVSADRDWPGVLGMFAADSKKPPWTLPTLESLLSYVPSEVQVWWNILYTERRITAVSHPYKQEVSFLRFSYSDCFYQFELVDLQFENSPISILFSIKIFHVLISRAFPI